MSVANTSSITSDRSSLQFTIAMFTYRLVLEDFQSCQSSKRFKQDTYWRQRRSFWWYMCKHTVRPARTYPW